MYIHYARVILEKKHVMCLCSRERKTGIGCISNKSHEDELDYEKLYGRVIFWLFSVTRQNEKFVVGCLRSTGRSREIRIVRIWLELGNGLR